MRRPCRPISNRQLYLNTATVRGEVPRNNTFLYRFAVGGRRKHRFAKNNEETLTVFYYKQIIIYDQFSHVNP